MENKDIEKCKTNYCKKQTQKNIKELEMTRKVIVTAMKKRLQNAEKSKSKGTKKNDSAVKELIDKFEKPIDKAMKDDMLESCIDAYCNPTCKDTVFEDGSKMSEEVEKKIEKRLQKNKGLTMKQRKDAKKMAMNLLTSIRKSIFKNKKSVLKDGFYEKLGKESIDKLKKKGALSGCSLAEF